MYRVSVGASSGLRCGVAGLIATILCLAVAAGPADARARKKTSSKRPVASAVYEPRYAAIVVDANSGDVMHSANADSLRHPASLTKVMTLYMLFERLESGRMKLDSRLDVSARAMAQAPTKLGVKAGQTIAVEDAIKALVTRSANDVAVVIAEALAGSEEDFARQMTRKARALGMSRTVYRNASGLPDGDQVTTARDQALLAMAIQDRFPRYYPYFAVQAFNWRGVSIRNHNRLLGRVDGVDGIKTGYTRASGFNLISSVKRGRRHIVAVVLGGRTGAQRDARMRELIEGNVLQASLNRTAPKVVEVAEAPAPRNAPKARLAAIDTAPVPMPVPAPRETAAAPDAEAPSTITANIPAPRPSPAPGSTEPLKPNLVKTVPVKAGRVQTAALAPLMLSPQPVTAQAQENFATRDGELPPPPPGARPGVLGVLTHNDVATNEAPASTASAPLKTASISSSAAPAAPAQATERAARPRSGWIIQVGAFDDKNEAMQRLGDAKSKASNLLGNSDPFTEPVMRGEKTLYRARFAGLKQSQAEAACKYLKRNDIACLAIKN